MMFDVKSYRPPFPWFGGKSRAASLIWNRLAHCLAAGRKRLAAAVA